MSKKTSGLRLIKLDHQEDGENGVNELGKETS